jgi:hypothetical protein
MTLSELKAALLTVTDKVHHFDATGETGSYIVWAEDGAGETFWADNKMKCQVITGTIDFFTKTEYDPTFGQIQAALDNLGICYRLNSTQREEDTKYIHYEWIWEMV